MRYVIFTDIHANLEALEVVLAKIDEIAQEKPIDQIWFLGDLVGYGPNPNECISRLRERTDVIIAGNHDWAAVGKIDLEDFSTAARISAEWTAEQLTEEHRTFLVNLPERIDIDECTLVHGSPYGPLWEYLTSEVLAERSFQYFTSRFCFVGHTHVPVIFQQPDTVANAPTLPLVDLTKNGTSSHLADDDKPSDLEQSEDEAELAFIQPNLFTNKAMGHAESAYADPATGLSATEEDANTIIEGHQKDTERLLGDEAAIIMTGEEQTEAEAGDTAINPEESASSDENTQQTAQESMIIDESATVESKKVSNSDAMPHDDEEDKAVVNEDQDEGVVEEGQDPPLEEHAIDDVSVPDAEIETDEVPKDDAGDEELVEIVKVTPEDIILSAEDRLNSEIEELLTLLGLSESMIQVTNEMLLPPEGFWEAPEEYRAIINPGGVGQPRDGDPRAAFMIYDTEAGFEFYRVPYDIEVTQEKIIQAGLPEYLAARLAVGR
jgi:diadenosine tetraphosphatase ApaH/serine/threonine PP2A family protein phosphatase